MISVARPTKWPKIANYIDIATEIVLGLTQCENTTSNLNWVVSADNADIKSRLKKETVLHVPF